MRLKGTFNCDILERILLTEKATFISLKCFCDQRLLTLEDYYSHLPNKCVTWISMYVKKNFGAYKIFVLAFSKKIFWQHWSKKRKLEKVKKHEDI